MKTVKRKACEGEIIEIIEIPEYEKQRYGGTRYVVGDLFEVQSVSKTSVRVFGREKNNNMPLVIYHNEYEVLERGELKLTPKKLKQKSETIY